MNLDHTKLKDFILKWVVARPRKLGTYGGGLDCMSILASLFSYEIMVLDISKKDIVLVYIGDMKGTLLTLKTKGALDYLKTANRSRQNIAVIKFNGQHYKVDAHFSAFVDKNHTNDYPDWLLTWMQTMFPLDHGISPWFSR